jgi:hypothetical protein
VIPFSHSGDGMTLSWIDERAAAVGRTRIDIDDKEKFPSAHEVSFQRCRDVPRLLEV